jgi:beta-lactam-binding protein with PASTA domain
MKKVLTYVSIIIGSFLLGFAVFYFIMPVIVRHSKTIEVPYLKHMSLEKAKSFLSSLDLKYVVADSVYSSEVAEGFIVSSEPPAKEDVKVGSVIKLVVSRGAKKVALPDIIGFPREAAVDSLDNYGITNRVFINYPVKEKDLDGKVVKTKPAIEDSIALGGMITIFVGTEKRKVFLMPNLIGMTLEEAQKEIFDYELVLTDVKRTSGEVDVVIQQFPAPSVEVTFGDNVRLVVGE